MALDSDRMAYLQMMATSGQDPSNLNPEERAVYDTLVEELNAAEGRVMSYIPFDWPDDKYDELTAATWKAWGPPAGYVEAGDSHLIGGGGVSKDTGAMPTGDDDAKSDDASDGEIHD